MARSLNPEGLLDQKNYLFKGYASYEEKLYEAFAKTCQKNKLPVKISEEQYKSGGLFSSRDVLLTIDGGFKPFAVLGAITYGDYLSVNLYYLVEDNLLNRVASTAFRLGSVGGLASFSKDMISIRDQQAFWNTVVACLEESFASLQFEEYQGGFLGIK